MPLYLIEAPDNDDVMTLADAKQHLRVSFDDDDLQIADHIGAAIQNLDGRDGWLGRALGEQVWELRLPEFCERGGREIKVPLPPLISIDSVKYYDGDDVLQTLSADDYEVVGVGGFGKARLVLKNGVAWPGLGRRAENVVVRFTAGYETVPRPILMAIKRQVASMYENRETVIIGSSVAKLPGAVEGMLLPLRVWP